MLTLYFADQTNRWAQFSVVTITNMVGVFWIGGAQLITVSNNRVFCPAEPISDMNLMFTTTHNFAMQTVSLRFVFFSIDWGICGDFNNKSNLL